MISQDRDVEAAEVLANALPQSADQRRIATLLAEMARAAPQPTARLVAARALVDVCPDIADVWRQLGQVALQASDFTGAACAFEKALARPGGGEQDRLTAGMAAYLGNDLDTAARLYGQAEAASPAAARGLADIAIARGDRAEAQRRLRAGLARWPGETPLLAALADLWAGEEVRPALTQTARDPNQPEALRAMAGFALAAVADREGDPRSAMCWARFANELSRAGQPRYRPEHEEAALARMLALDDAIAGTPAEIEEGIQPLLVVGAPRSGTSIVESLLAAHPEVAAGGERMDLAMAARELEIVAASRGVAAAAAVFAARRDGLRTWVEARLCRAGIKGPRYTDKLPQNLLNVGVVARLFPSARIVCVRRDPRETALSIYLLNFAGAYPYATDLADLVHAMRLADRAVAEWEARLGDRLLVVDHEAFSADPAGQGRRLYEFCGLSWSDRYLRPSHRDAPMRTFSALQVRDAIRPRAPRWPEYRPWIEPLIQAFGAGTKPLRLAGGAACPGLQTPAPPQPEREADTAAAALN